MVNRSCGGIPPEAHHFRDTILKRSNDLIAGVSLLEGPGVEERTIEERESSSYSDTEAESDLIYARLNNQASIYSTYGIL